MRRGEGRQKPDSCPLTGQHFEEGNSTGGSDGRVVPLPVTKHKTGFTRREVRDDAKGGQESVTGEGTVGEVGERRS
jgi:hypothetical protein